MSSQDLPEDISFRIAEQKDLPALKSLFVDTITAVCHKDYSPEQIKAWTASVEKIQRWTDLLNDQFVLVAQKTNTIIGFASLKDGEYLDFFYIHKAFQGQGIAKHLYAQIEKEAIHQGAKTLTSDISITAKPFFESRGFVSLKKQVNQIRGVELINYKMSKTLAS